MEDVTAVAVTNRPGLKGPLIVGTNYAKETTNIELDPEKFGRLGPSQGYTQGQLFNLRISFPMGAD